MLFVGEAKEAGAKRGREEGEQGGDVREVFREAGWEALSDCTVK